MNSLTSLPNRVETSPSGLSANCKWLTVIAACLLLPGAQAASLFQEGFDYTSGLALAGQGTWATTTNSAFITVGSGSLTYPGLADVTPAGNEARIAGQSASLASYTFSPFSASVSSGQAYASFLLDFNGTVVGGNYTFMGLLPAAASGPGNGGNFNNTYDPCDLVSRSSSGNVQLGIRTLGQGTTYATPTLSLGSVNLIVMKYDFAAKTASLFINPNPNGAEPGTASAFSTGTLSAANLDQFYLRIGGVNQGNYLVDDVRIGTTWVEVVPEPATITLIGLGVLGFGLLRRIRR
jgi:hypothetical protein